MALPALVLMLGGVAAPIGGSHVFRQAHVAANIDKFVEDGLSLRPSTYNGDVPFPAFDFPLYQLAVAGACRLVPIDPLVAARVASLLLFVTALGVLDRLLLTAGIRRCPRLATLALFAGAPLCLFYFQAPMVDGLAVVLALVSLHGYVAAEREGGAPRPLTLLAGYLSTLIKSPVYLPVFVAVLWHRARSQGVRSLARRDTALLVATAGLGVLSFKAYWMLVNGTSDLLTPFERRHYFGTLAQRFSASAWRPVLSDLLHRTASPVTVLLAVFGTVYWVRRGGAASVFTGMLVGCGASLLVFFDRYSAHNYYQLPFVFPVAFFGAQGLQSLRVLARAGRRFARPAWRAARLAVPLAALAAAAWGWTGFRELRTSNPAVELTRQRGEWIHEHTSRDDYVIYVFDGTVDDWNPAFLYFARRDGYNLPRRQATPERLAGLAERTRGRFRSVLVFTFHPDVKDLLTALGAEVVAAGHHRALFRLGRVRGEPRGPAS